jgi:cation transport ATPase
LIENEASTCIFAVNKIQLMVVEMHSFVLVSRWMLRFEMGLAIRLHGSLIMYRRNYMRVSAFLESVIITVASTAAIEVAAKSWARFSSVQLRPDTLLICALIAAVTAAYWIRAQRKDRSMKLRLDLLFRMCYQGPFLEEIRHDAASTALRGKLRVHSSRRSAAEFAGMLQR